MAQLSITKPTVGGSANTWGATLNTALDAIVAAVNVALPPWQFHVADYGAVGNGVVITDGAITSGSHTLTSASALFPASGSILVSGAGGGTYTALGTTFAGSAGSTTLVAAASSTVTGAICYFGTDDTAAITSCINAATAYAQAHDGFAEVLFDNKIYIIGGVCVTGGSTHGNAQIPLPVISTTSNKVTLKLTGVGDATALPHWLQTTPQTVGTVLACARNDGTSTSDGVSCIIGGPVNGYGAGTSVFSNMLFVLDKIAGLVPYNGTYAGFDGYGLAEMSVPNAACNGAAVVPTGGPVPSMGTPTNFTVFSRFGLRMPSTNNNALADIGYYSSEGMVNGLWASEHTTFSSLRIINSYSGLVPYVGTSGNMPHALNGDYACIENVQNAIASVDTGTIHMNIDTLDMEGIGNAIVSDGGYLMGTVGWSCFALANPVVAGSTGLKLVNMGQVAGAVTAPGVPSSTTALLNPFWRDAFVRISGGTVTAVSVDGQSQGATPGLVMVPAGKSITLTYSSAPTWTWLLT